MPTSETRVRVAYFVPPSRHFAGIERVVHEIAAGLAAEYGDLLDVHVLFCSQYGVDALRDTPYTMHVLGVSRLRHMTSALRVRVAEEDFDILICPQVEASVIAWFATRGLRLPIFISHLHGNPRIEETNGTRRTRIAFTLFRHVVSRRIAAVLAVSPSLQRYAAGAVTRHAPVHHAKNPVRALHGADAKSEHADSFRFLSVARLSRQKGLDILLRAVAHARPELPSVRLTLVGGGPDEGALRQLSDELGVADIVTFAGYDPEPVGHFLASDCFVLSSRWEGFPLVLLEALRCGLPLLAADCDFGPRDLITDPRIGELVPAGNVEALAAGLKRAVVRPADSADAAFRRATASAFDRDEAARMHVDVLKQIVADQPISDTRLRTFAST